MSVETHSIYSDSSDASARCRGALASFLLLASGLFVLGLTTNAAELTLSWNDNSNNVDGFRIERSSDGSSFIEIATVGANVATYQDTTIAEDQNYTYRVRAFNEFGNSGYSNSASGSVGSTGNNEADTIVISFSGLKGGVYEPGQTDAFQVVVSGTQSAIQSVQFFDNDNFVATDNSDPYDFTFSPVSEGTHALKAVVTTDFGVYDESVFVTVEIPVNLSPTISELSDLSLAEGVTSALVEFTIGDSDTSLSELIVSASSSNTALIGEEGIVLNGSGANRSIELTATEGRSGKAIITISVSDGVTETVETLEVVVQTAPVIVSQPVNTEAIVGDITAFDVEISAYPEANIQWLRNGQPIEGANGTELLFTQVSLEDAGTYSVVVFNELGSVSSNVVQLTVESLISIVESPVDVLIEQEGTATLSVAATGPGLTYQWYRGESGDRSNPIEGATESSYTTDALTEDTQYWVEIKTGGIAQGLETAESSTIEVNIVAPSRFYFGSISREAGTFALMVREDKSAVFLSDFGSEPMEIIDLQISESGTFQYANENGFVVMEGIVDLESVSGFFNGSIYSFTGVRAGDQGATTDFDGFYTAVLPNTSDGQVLVIAGPDGQAYVTVGLGASGAAGGASIDSRGVLTADLEGEYAFALQLDDSVKSLNGSLLIGSDNYAVDGQREDIVARNLLFNTSIRGQVGGGSSTMIAGFVVGGTGTKRVLIRGLGPALAERGVGNAIGDPMLELYRLGEADPIAENDNWQSASNAFEIPASEQLVGATPLANGSRDAALLLELSGGVYTAVVKNLAGGDGTALVEVFDVSESAGDSNDASLANISMRGEVGRGNEVIIAGFVVTGDSPKRLLIRAMGSELTNFGVSNTLANPQLSIYQATAEGQVLIAENDDWQEEASVVTAAASTAGAFEFGQFSQSSAKVIWLDPGVYTAVAQSSDSTKGVVLVEVYEVE